MYKLTIGIPTYNRFEFLKKSLDRLKYLNNPDVEIIVSDNASTDKTEVFMKNLVESNPSIKYIRNKINLGPDKNFKKILDVSRGEFTLLLSDDDELDLDYINDLLYFLDQNKDIGIVIINIKGKNSNLFNFENPVIYEQKKLFDFFVDVNVNISFLSIIIYNTYYYKKIANKEKYLSTNLFQAGVLFQILSLQKKAGLFPHISVKGTHNKKLGYDFNQVFIKYLNKILFSSDSKSILSYKQRRKIFKKYFKFIINWNYMIKTKQIEAISTYSRDVRKILKNYIVEYFILMIIKFTPRFVLMNLFNLRKKIKK